MPGDPDFEDITSFSLDTVYKYIAIADIDGDGKKDIIATNLYETTIDILRNTSGGSSISFAAPVHFAGPPLNDDYSTVIGFIADRNVVCGDFDGDGKVDIAITNALDSTVSVYRNTATPGSITSSSLAPRKVFKASRGPIAPIVADFDGDGKSDILITSSFIDWLDFPGNVFSILRNDPAAIYGQDHICIGSATSLSSGVAGGTWTSGKRQWLP